MRTPEQEERIKKDFPIYEWAKTDSKNRKRTSVQACCSTGLFTLGRLIGLKSQIRGLMPPMTAQDMCYQIDNELGALEHKWLNDYGVVLRPHIPEGYAKVGKKLRCLSCDAIYGEDHDPTKTCAKTMF